MRRACIVIAAFLALTGCCDKQTKRIQPHWLRSYEGYQLYLVELRRQDVKIPFTGIVDQRGNCFVDLPVEGCLATERYGFWLELTNKTTTPMQLLWSEVRYVDEAREAHTIYLFDDDPPEDVSVPEPPQEVPAGGRYREMIVPGYKTYMVGSCREQHVFKEPLVPTRLDD